MGRQIRIEYAGALYHVMSHGNGFQWIYKNRKHLDIFINVLISVIKKFKVKIHAVVIMKNHYHLLIELTEANLSKAMKKLNCDFARIFNRETGRKGSVIRDRYKSILIQTDKYYFNALRYISQNPVRQKLFDKCEDYCGSFLNWIDTGLINENLLSLDTIKEHFGPENWKSNFYYWLNETREKNPFNSGKLKYFCGTKDWVKAEIKKVDSIKLVGVKEERQYSNITIDETKIIPFLNDMTKKEKNIVLLYLYAEYSGLSNKEIMNKFNICSESACQKRISRIRNSVKNDESIKKLVTKIVEVL